MIKVTLVQSALLRDLHRAKVLKRPRHGLELLQKKGLVKGNKRSGWMLTLKGLAWMEQNR